MDTPVTDLPLAQAEAPFILALDIGSSSTRALLYDARARRIAAAAAHEAYTLRIGSDGAAEVDPNEALERAARCLDAVLALAGPAAARIGAVAVDTLAATFVALDAAGRPLTPLITYADTRAAPDAAALRRGLAEREIHERTGCPLRGSYWPARLAWVQRCHPEVWSRAARWATLGEYLELRLFGQARLSYSAAAWTGLLDRRRLTWDAPLLRHLGADVDRFRPLVDVDAPLAGLGAAYARRWPALRAVPWFPAIGDGAAANIGSGCVGPDQLALTLGTTGALRLVQTDVPEVPAGLWCYRIDRGRALLGGATSEGGNVYAWLRQTLRLGDPAEVEAALAAYPPDGHGLTVLPFLAGERSPGWAGAVPASVHGLTLATPPIAIVRASLEAVALRFAEIQARLPPADPPRQLIASGSALRGSPAWAQIFADVLGRPVVISAEPEATSRGAALLALRSLGVVPALESVPAAAGPRYAPDDARHRLYQAAQERQRWLYGQLITAVEAE